VVITGASSGLGADAAQYLARQGKAVVLGFKKTRLERCKLAFDYFGEVCGAG